MKIDRDICLEDLANRHPEATEDADQTKVSTHAEETSKSFAMWAIRAVGQVTVGLGAGYVLLWVLHWIPTLGPGP